MLTKSHLWKFDVDFEALLFAQRKKACNLELMLHIELSS
jgi:hypothetical protein